MPAHLVVLSPAVGATVTAAAKSSSGGSLLFVVIAVVVIGGVLLLNRRRQAKAIAEHQTEITVGGMVVTIGGMIATLVERTDDYVVLQLEDGTRARFLPRAVARAWSEPATDPEQGRHSVDAPPAEDGSPPD